MKKNKSTIEINDRFQEAIEKMEQTNTNLFITGRAGTGKSILLRHFLLHTKKKAVVLAPTGVAAVNVGGQTIHSFFQFKPDVNERSIRALDEKKYTKLETIIIDEVSMVRADLLDYIDQFLRLNGPDGRQAFGGVQMIFIGDLYQLPPVVTSSDKRLFTQKYASPYFFSAQVFFEKRQQMIFDDDIPFELEHIELEKIYRQEDDTFIDILNAVRNDTVTHQHIALLNKQLNIQYKFNEDDMAMYLTTTNAMAASINTTALSAIKEDELIYYGRITGAFDKKALPTDDVLRIKMGAQVMMLNNDQYGRWINGTIGKVVDVSYDESERYDMISVELQTGILVDVTPHTWDMFEYAYDKKSGHVEPHPVGSFTQYPMKLAWAITIHKSQGKTFDRVILDVGRGTFAPGQLYVALSRCTSLEGLTLKRPIESRHVFIDRHVNEFFQSVNSTDRV